MFKETEFNAFKNATIKAIKANCGEKGRKFYDSLTEFLKSREAKGLAYVRVNSENEFETGISKFITPEQKEELKTLINFEVNDTIFFIADEKDKAIKFTNMLRNELGEKLNLINKDEYNFVWIETSHSMS